jgi:hypothetical protein
VSEAGGPAAETRTDFSYSGEALDSPGEVCSGYGWISSRSGIEPELTARLVVA